MLITAPCLPQPGDRLLGREIARDQLSHEVGDQLAAHLRVDLLADDDQVGHEGLGFQGARDGVVIGDRELRQPRVTRALHQLAGSFALSRDT